MEKYADMLKACGAAAAKVINASTIVTAPWVAHKCKYGCPHYGKNRCCPPYSPAWDYTQSMIDCFDKAIIFSCKSMSTISPLALRISRAMLRDGLYKNIPFGGGPCTGCRVCTPDDCPYPSEAVPSMEACGIDVFATCRANGLSIACQTEPNAIPDCIGLILVE